MCLLLADRGLDIVLSHTSLCLHCIYKLEMRKMLRRYGDKMKRVIMIASVPSMIGQFNMGNIRLLQELGYQVDVACDFRDRSVWTEERTEKLIKELKESGAGICQVDFSRSVWRLNRHIRAWRQLRKILTEKKYEFLHCHTPIAGVLGRIAGHQEQVKVIYTAHGFHFYQGAPLKNWLLYYPVEKYLSVWTDVLITINKEDYERAVNRFKAKKTEYVPGIGIDLKRIEEIKSDRTVKRAELNIPENKVLLLSVGELNKNKNHKIVIESLVKSGIENICYIICGQGKLEDELKLLITKNNFQERVKLLGFRRDVVELCQASDIFVFPSRREGLPVALMEAMACGLPAICSDIRGSRELIQDGTGGYVVRRNTSREYTRMIKQLVLDTDFRKKAGRHNKKAVENYSLDVVAKLMKTIYTAAGNQT